MAQQSGERFHALDAVRGAALLLGVFFHGIMSFMPGEWVWFVMDSQRDPIAIVVFFTLHIFRMTTFFLIAGFFAHMLFHKRGLGGFVKNRAARIALPLVIFWPLVFGGLVGAVILMAIMAGITEAPEQAAAPSDAIAPFPLTHLWFLYVLLFMYAGALLLRAPVAALDRSGALRKKIDGVVGWCVRTPLVGPILLGAPTCALFIAKPNWMTLVGIPPADGDLVPNLVAMVAYGTAFGLGWLLHRNYAAMRVWSRQWLLYLPLAIALSAACLAVHGVVMPPRILPLGPEKIFFAVCYALAIWCWTFAFVGLALRFLDSESPARRYIADASYWIYIAHMPLVMALQAAIINIEAAWWAKYAVLMAVTFALLFASYQVFVRHTIVGRLLNGPRPAGEKRRAKGASEAPQAARGNA